MFDSKKLIATISSIVTITFFSTIMYAAPIFTDKVVAKVIEQEVGADFNKQLECLTKNIYFEAATESYEGKLAVAQVVLNRAKNPKFPKNICAVVYQNTNGVYQFSWVGLKDTIVRNKYAWQESELVARMALTEPVLHDRLAQEKALYYHAVYVNPGWRNRVITKIGNHIFYAGT
jgi:spore germination cell wall hydrolase CwlJ-like protein